MQLSLFQQKHARPAPAESHLEKQLRAVLRDRLPEPALDDVVGVMFEHPVSLRVTRNRTSKLGDYRPAQQNLGPRISVNGTLNPYAFLITLIHELAHHHVQVDYQQYLGKFTFRRKVKPLPHGTEWKEKFRKLMAPFLNNEIFPAELLPVLHDYFKNPKASSSADHDLARALKCFDPPDPSVRLEILPFDAVFSLQGRRIFRKKERVRTRYLCVCLKTNKIYLVSAAAPVIRIEL